MDEVEPLNVYSAYHYIFDGIKDSGHMDYGDNLFSWTERTFFPPKRYHCENCSTKEHKNGSVTYYHSAITPVFVPLPPVPRTDIRNRIVKMPLPNDG